MEKPLNLYETSWQLFGARNALMNMYDVGSFKIDATGKSQGGLVYNKAIYDLLMHDDNALLQWLAMPSIGFRYFDWQKDKKGNLVSCKAALM